MRALRVGLVSLAFSNFEAEKHEVFERGREDVRKFVDESGTDVEFFTVDHLIQTRAESVHAAAFFKEKEIDFLLIQFGSLNLGDVVLPLVSSCSRLGFWIVPEPTYEEELQLNSLTGFNLTASIFHQFIRENSPKSKAKVFFGGSGNKMFDLSLGTTLRALYAAVNTKGSTIGQLGRAVPTFINLEYEPQVLYRNLGIDVADINIEELISEYKKVSAEDLKRYGEKFRQAANSIRVDDEWINKSARIYGGVEKLKERYGLDALALRCWPELQSEIDIAPCAAVALLNDTDVVTGCEGDLIGTISMFTGRIVSGAATTMNDPVAVDEKTDTIQMWHCGPGPSVWADEAGQCLDYHHTLNRRKDNKSEWTGVSSDISFRKGPVTVMRFKRDGEGLFVFEADVVEGPAPPFPGSGGWFGSFKSNNKAFHVMDFIETVKTHGIEHHYPVAMGHIEDVYREMAVWMDLEVLPFKSWNYFMDSSNDLFTI